MRNALGIAALVTFLSGVGGAYAAPPANARVDCAVRENGKIASATFRVLAGDAEFARGSCGRPVEVRPGSYEVAIVLDGVVDAPGARQPVEARAGQLSTVEASFETGELVVEVTRAGKRSVGTVRLLRGTAVLASFSTGVPNRVSVGTYSVEVEARGDRRVFQAVTIARGERRSLAAEMAQVGAQASQ